jgi:aryl-alcohol dehydrogenase-like predicted oxidoreductase
MTNKTADVPTVALGDQLTVSAIGFGAMALTPVYGEVDDTESLATLHRCLDIGVTFIDTANIYGSGNNERLISKLLADRRDEVTLATKFGIASNPADRAAGSLVAHGDAAYVHKSIDESLSRLKTDVVDLYYMHRRDPSVPIEETVGAMAELVQEGKVRHLGLSEAAPGTIRRGHAVHPISALQTEYSLWSRDPEAEILPTVRELGIGFVAYAPLGRGFLTGAIRSVDELDERDFRRRGPRFQEENLQHNLELVSVVEALAAEKGAKPSQIALAWVLSRGDDIVPIPGTKRRSYLEENAAAAKIELTPAELERLEQAFPAGAAAGERYPDMSSVNR